MRDLKLPTNVVSKRRFSKTRVDLFYLKRKFFKKQGVKKDEEDFSVEEKTGEREPFKQIELNLKKVLFRLNCSIKTFVWLQYKC
jgi:hypothetical protein